MHNQPVHRPLILGSSLALLASVLVGATPALAQPEVQPRSMPAAAAPVKGTPAQIITEVPVTEPLTVGYDAGLFIPKGGLYKKNKSGCTLRNQMLIKMASKKPKVGKNCTLSGGEWLVDFGTKRVTKAQDVKLRGLLPDNVVYGQGAYGWTEAQRRAYGASYAPAPTRSTRSLGATIESEPVQGFSPSGDKVMGAIHEAVGAKIAPGMGVPGELLLEAELAQLRAKAPALFENWTVATLLNAKSWGLSLSPGMFGSFQVTIEECASANPEKGDANPCTKDYTVPNEAARYSITPVPMTASLQPADVVSKGASTVPTISYGPPTGETISRSLFGLHAPAHWVSDTEGDEATGFEGPTDEATIPDVPVGFLRLWDTETTWADIEPSKGDFRFRKLERQIQTAQITDSRVMLVLGGTPAWAGDGTPQSAPTNVADWRSYVHEVACHFGPSISAYEVWNEANLADFWTGTPVEMADLTAAAFDEIRKCNASALVVAANTTSRATGSFGTFYPAYLTALKERGWPVDAYSVHSYPTASGGANDRIRGIGQFKTMLALAGAPQTTIFDTEINYGLAGLSQGKVNLTGDNAMALMSRTYIDSARYGFASTFWFVWTAQPDSKFGIQFTRAADAEKTAWRTTYDWLVGSQFQRCLEADGITICQFNRGADNFSIIWRGDVGSASAPAPLSILGQLGSRFCDLRGNCNELTSSATTMVGFMPMRIEGAPVAAGTTPMDVADTEVSPDMAPPSSLNVEVVYGASDKANGIAAWVPSRTTLGAPSITYAYEWQFCDKDECTTFASGTTSLPTTSVDLRKGAGKYRFVVRAQVCVTVGGDSCVAVTSTDVERTFMVLSGRATPPSSVMLNGGTRVLQMSWAAPRVPTRTIKYYEVQIRASSQANRWRELGTYKKAGTVTFQGSDWGCDLGTTCQIRVRTVMESGLSSPFVASNELTIAEALNPPIGYVYGYRGSADGFVLQFWYPENIDGTTTLKVQKYPDLAYQLRYSVDGSTWTTAQVGTFDAPTDYGCPAPRRFEEGSTNAPYCSDVIFIGPDIASAKYLQVRAVGGALDLIPSEWVDVPLKSMN